MSLKNKELESKKNLVKDIEMKLNKLIFGLYKLNDEEINIINNSANE